MGSSFKKRPKLMRILMVLLIALGFQGLSLAASFDCAKAIAAREKLICGNKPLSELDSQLGALYAEKKALLSPQGNEQLRKSQLSWLRYTASTCSLNPSEEQRNMGYPEACFEKEYYERIRELSTIQKIGPYIFNRIDDFSAKPSVVEEGGSPGFDLRHVTYPQIDNLNTPLVEVWNKMQVVQSTAGMSGECDDEDVGFELGYASDRLISVSWSTGEYCHGTPHGFSYISSENVILLPSPHNMIPADLFGPGDEWIPKLQGLLDRHLTVQGWEETVGGGKDELLGVAVRPDRWLLTADGLQILFGSYEGGCFACTPRDPITISWTELKPFLASNAPVP